MNTLLALALAASTFASAAPAILQDIRVGGQDVTLMLTRPVGYRASRKASPPAVIITLDDTDVSQEARDKSSASMVVAGIQALPVADQGGQSARIIIQLDKNREFSPEWAGNDLVIKFKEPVAGEAPAPKPTAVAEKPAAPKADAQPPAPAGTWRVKGKLAAKDGKPLEGDHAVAFRIKDSSNADVWSEWIKVNAKEGSFWAVLGQNNPLPESFEGTKLLAESDAGTITLPVHHIQIASFPAEDTAKKLKADLEPKFGAITVKTVTVGGKKVFRVLLGPADRAGAQGLLEKAKAAGYGGILQ